MCQDQKGSFAVSPCVHLGLGLGPGSIYDLWLANGSPGRYHMGIPLWTNKHYLPENSLEKQWGFS